MSEGSVVMKFAMLFTSGASNGRCPGYHGEQGSASLVLEDTIAFVSPVSEGKWDFDFHLWPWRGVGKRMVRYIPLRRTQFLQKRSICGSEGMGGAHAPVHIDSYALLCRADDLSVFVPS